MTLDKTEGYHDRISYHDYAISPELFHWQTQNNAGPDTPAGRRYIESPENGWRFFLFVRENKEAAYCAWARRPRSTSRATDRCRCIGGSRSRCRWTCSERSACCGLRLLENIRSMDKLTATLQVDGRGVRTSNPLEQAKQYAYGVCRLLESDPALVGEPGTSFQGKLVFPWGYGVVLANISLRIFND